MSERLDDKKKPSRRDALRILVGAPLSALIANESRAKEIEEIEYLPSSLTDEQLERQKLQAIHELIDGFWNHAQVRSHISHSFFGEEIRTQTEMQKKLENESQMYIPTREKSEDIRNRNRTQLGELSTHIPEKKYGLLLDGDEQRLYILQKMGKGQIQFVKAYPVSTSKSEWSNAFNSRGTPIGLHRIAAAKKGMLGELLSSAQRGPRDFTQINVNERGVTRKRTFVKSLLSSGDATPELITAELLIAGSETRSTRGIYIHGTNRIDKLGKYDSGGCIRVSNVDIWDIFKYVEIGKLQKDERTVIDGTPLMITATQKSHPHEGQGPYPPRWKPPPETPAKKESAKTEVPPSPPRSQPSLEDHEIPGFQRRSNPPPRWRPPEK